MAYTAPTVTASGTTFAQLRAGGLTGVVDRLIVANTVTPAEMAFINSSRHGRIQDVYDGFRQRLDNFVNGEPVDLATYKAEMKSIAKVLTAFLAAFNEVNVLIDANPGTLTTVPTKVGYPKAVRSFP